MNPCFLTNVASPGFRGVNEELSKAHLGSNLDSITLQTMDREQMV